MIETISDWNYRLASCGCCEMPGYPLPNSYLIEREGVSVESYGAFDGNFPWRVYRIRRTETPLTQQPDYVSPDGLLKVEYSGGDGLVTWTDTYSERFKVLRCGEYDPHSKTIVFAGNYSSTQKTYTRDTISDPWELDFTVTRTTTKIGLDSAATWQRVTQTDSDPPVVSFIGYAAATNGGPGFIPLPDVEVHEESKTYPEWQDEAYPQMTFSDCGGSFLGSLNLVKAVTTIIDPPGANGEAYAKRQKTRFKFKVPVTHTGSAFRMTYDVVEYPEDGAPTIISEDNVIEWVGPGINDASDPSWLSPWSEPFESSTENAGTVRIVNVRYSAYTSTRYGSKPAVTGEAF